MALNLRIERVLALPGTPSPSTLYLVQSEDSTLLDIYVVGASVSEVRHIIKKSEILSMITNAVMDFTNIRVVADIPARDSMSPNRNMLVLVLDATLDMSVISGTALYIFDYENTSAWIKVSEFESLELSMEWGAIRNRPISSTAQIDDAVSKVHTHPNKVYLDKISEDPTGRFIYNGNGIQATVTRADW